MSYTHAGNRFEYASGGRQHIIEPADSETLECYPSLLLVTVLYSRTQSILKTSTYVVFIQTVRLHLRCLRIYLQHTSVA